MFKYITSRPLWVNMAVAFCGLILLIFIFIISLNWFTKHGESRTVPAVTGKKVDDVKKMLKEKGFEMVIQDSVFYDSLPPGIVLKQVPDGDDVVKVNRTVYVTINRFLAPDIEMPNLVGSSFRNAEMVLKSLGLRIGDTSYRFDFAKNSVLEQTYKGTTIAAGTKIKMGSSIALVLGSGLGNEDMKVPDLIGMSYEEAKAMLDAEGLSGVVMIDPGVKDTATAFVYKQSPTPRTEDGANIRIRPGQMVDIWVGPNKPASDSTKTGNLQ